MIVANVITGVVAVAVQSAFGFLPRFGSIWVGGTIASAVAAPYTAYVLTVLYYRLTAPGRPTVGA